MAIRSYKYRLYPSKKQTLLLEALVEEHRKIYNHALGQRIAAWECDRVTVSYYDQCSWLNQLRDLANCSSFQQTLIRLDKAYKSFFNGGGFPRFKGFGRFRTVEFVRMSDGIQIKDGRLYIQNIGKIKVKWHRKMPKPKRATITVKNGKWYVFFCCEVEVSKPIENNLSCGIDLGVKTFATFDDGSVIKNPRHLKAGQKLITLHQQSLAKCKKGSKKRKKVKLLVAKSYEKVSNQRLDFHHKAAKKIVDAFGTICIEDLSVKKMVEGSKKRNLNRSIADAGLGNFIRILKTKAENAGCKIIEVDPAFTSQTCSGCGDIVKKTLKERTHSCKNCGLELCRDHNSAIIIREKGLDRALASARSSCLKQESGHPIRSKNLGTLTLGLQNSMSA